MKSNKPSRQTLLSMCAELEAEDGTDPREYFRKKTRGNKSDRKARQLCKQVADTLGYVLSGECDDAILRNVMIVSVDPAPDASRLLVTITPMFSDSAIDVEDVMQKLSGVAGRLRCAVSESINRKRTPELFFRVMLSTSENDA